MRLRGRRPVRDINDLKVKAYDPMNVLEHREDPIFVQPSEVGGGDRGAYEAAVLWTAETSTDPELVYAAALGVTAITWQPTRYTCPDPIWRQSQSLFLYFISQPPDLLRISCNRVCQSILPPASLRLPILCLVTL